MRTVPNTETYKVQVIHGNTLSGVLEEAHNYISAHGLDLEVLSIHIHSYWAADETPPGVRHEGTIIHERLS